jgi:DNA polymerase-1
MHLGSCQYREVWAVDFEFMAEPGERPRPICMVAMEIGTGRLKQLWQDDLTRRRHAPYPADRDVLFVAYYASAEIGCHLELGWPIPANVIDLFAEFRNTTNGKPTECGASLLGALVHFGIDAIEATDKETMRRLALRGGPWTAADRQALLKYCTGDVTAVARLFQRMLPLLDVDRALLRGRYMAAAAQIEAIGTPIDVPAWSRITTSWGDIRRKLIERVDIDYGVYERDTFKVERFARWLRSAGISWPRLCSGHLALSDEVFQEMARRYPVVEPLRQLRTSLSQFRLHELAVGRDGRNRCLLSAFRSTTGRNQPSNSRFIFGFPTWLRSLIRPEPGMGLAYVDWAQQEFGIAAALSGDPAMQQAYASGDSYLAFAKQARAIPSDATKATHKRIRELFKTCALGVQYGMGPESLARQIGRGLGEAQSLLQAHRDTYPGFWRWSDAALNYAYLNGSLYTAFGWTLRIHPDSNPRSLRNFPMQANGAEMLRIACCFAIRCGVRVCAPIHDAILIEAPAGELAHAVRLTQSAMAEASAAVLNGFHLRTEATTFVYPERYRDERGSRLWHSTWKILDGLPDLPERPCTETCAPAPQHLGTSAPPVHLLSGLS